LKKQITLFFILLVSVLPALAKHIAGGEMTYTYLGTGSSATKGLYRITLKLYRDCDSDGAQLDAAARITIYPAGSTVFEFNQDVRLDRIETVRKSKPDACINNPPEICYQIAYYNATVELAFLPKGYVVSYQRCCRVDDIFNITQSEDVGVTYTTSIPGTADVATGPANSTPVFNTSDTVIICSNNYFTYDFGASDADNDQLEFKFANAFDGATMDWPMPDTANAPPYKTVAYNFGFSAQSPLGPNVTIDPITGFISGVAPVQGVYALTVTVVERRNGSILNIHRKDLHLLVSNCSIAKAELNSNYINCEGSTLSFQNLSNSPLIKSYNWDFGISTAVDDTSILSNPAYTYSLPGEYTVRLITNKNDICSDTAYATAKIWPGFTANFNAVQTCVGVPFAFNDSSKTVYGSLNKWHWDFGDASVSTDTSSLKNSSYIYSTKGTYSVTLIAGSDRGCLDTLVKSILVDDKPYLKISGDTIMCTQDGALRLNAIGTGTYQWTGENIIGSSTVQNPLVSPTVPTRYNVTVTQAPGCINIASVFVDVRSFVSLDAGNDTTICLGDSILLNPISDGISYAWTPISTVTSPTLKKTWARPTETTRYAVLAKIGTCQALDGFVVTTVPYPAANAGMDTLICFGKQVQLNASGGLQYLWYPYGTLDDNTLKDPIASPISTTSYVVGVFDNKGCPKPAYDTVLVEVVPPVIANAGNDTAVVIGQPLQLNAQGGQQFQWLPPDFLSNAGISNPIARLNSDIQYIVKVSTRGSCFAYDTMNVKVYKTPPEIFVPTAFTPNGDGLNDNLVPIPVGIISIEYFKVYNRYGELVFSTSSMGKGWNGVYKGRDQGNESFVWQVLGKDYLGKPLYKKGESTLIR
jgi:gliding motility-associated-like protein